MAKLNGGPAALPPTQLAAAALGGQGTWAGVQLLVVEDDLNVARALDVVLRRHGFEVVMARTGRDALRMLGAATDLVLLDLGLPDIDGLEVCREIRRRSDVPVIMVTARSGVASRVRGLEMGADDYVTKPYDLREVLARIQTVLRRRRTGELVPEAVSFDSFSINFRRREVRLDDQTVLPLTRKEFDLLALLANRTGTVVSREQILHEVWSTGWKGMERSLEVHIAGLRRKFGDRDIIHTSRGIGYYIDDVAQG